MSMSTVLSGTEAETDCANCAADSRKFRRSRTGFNTTGALTMLAKLVTICWVNEFPVLRSVTVEAESADTYTRVVAWYSGRCTNEYARATAIPAMVRPRASFQARL